MKNGENRGTLPSGINVQMKVARACRSVWRVILTDE